MLVNLKEVLDHARINNYAVGMFNTFNIEMAKGILDAAEQTRSPVIFGTAEALLPCCDIETVSYFLIPMAKKASVPVVVHLDHGYTESILKQAIDTGFTSVMYDCSMKPFEENLMLCREMAEYAHKHGASVEGELGHLTFEEGGSGGNEDYIYTEPEEVEEFVERSNIDALAIAIGTEHGVYKSKPVLDIERLKKIRGITDTNLVLHGGSSLELKDLQACIKNGIQKVNIYTDVSIVVCDAASESIKKNGKAIDKVSIAMREASQKIATQKMIELGSCGKA